MRLICPSCGAMHSAEAWTNDEDARQVVATIAELPRDVARWALPYLGLFRPKARVLSWKRARRLVEELRDFAMAPEISWKGQPPRPNAPEAWARGLEQISVRPPGDLPLQGHNYLRAIVYGLADEMDKRKEAQGTGRRAQGPTVEEIQREHADLTDEKLRENQARVRNLIGNIGR